jgi:molecular chaperone DnaK
MGTIGIDLGTTNTVVAAVRDGRASTIEDEQGNRLIPSIVSFHPNGSVLVGQIAKERRHMDAANTIYSVKRLIGRPWKSPEVQESLTRFPFDLREGPKDTTMVVARGEQYALPEISAFVLRRAKQIAEARLGEAVDRAVITVPANFNDLQRAATKVAGKLAGLEVMRILNEPTAAALAYGQSIAHSERIAIFDLGGGTFDITLLDLSGQVFEVLATAGDTSLGGDDIDVLIAERMSAQFREIHRFDPRSNQEAFGKLRLLAEQVKIQLSQEPEVTANLNDIAYGEGGASLSIRFRMNRKELEHLIKPLIDKTVDVTRFAIETIGQRRDAFDRIILVGGSTRMPIVARAVEDYFGKPPFVRVNPDEVVALGAAIQAYSLDKTARRPDKMRAPALSESTLSGITPAPTLHDRPAPAPSPTRRAPPPAPPARKPPPPAPRAAFKTHDGFPELPKQRKTLVTGADAEDRSFESFPSLPRGPAPVPAPAPARPSPPKKAEVPTPATSFDLPEIPSSLEPPPPAAGRKPETVPGRAMLLDRGEDPSLSFQVAEPPDQSSRISTVPPLEKPPAKTRPMTIPTPAVPVPVVTPPAARRPSPPPPAKVPTPPPPREDAMLVPDPDAIPIDFPTKPVEEGIIARKQPLLIDVTPLSLSVETVAGYCDILIPANSPVPCDRTRIFLTAADGQTMVCVNVAQGESRRFHENTFLGQLELTGLSARPRGEVRIAVTFELDADGILNVRAQDTETGRETQAKMRLLGGVSDEAMGHMLARQAAHEVH